MGKQIFLDMDGVIVDWDAGVRYSFNVDWYPTEWKIPYQKVFGMSSEDFWKCIDYGFWWAGLPWTKDGKEVYEMVRSFKPCILTIGRTTGAANGKRSWIKRNLPEVFKEGRYFVGGGPTKHFFAHPKAILIDDCDDYCEAWEKASGRAILYPRPWNKNRTIQDPVEYLKRMLAEYL
jgi:hypothetical protein